MSNDNHDDAVQDLAKFGHKSKNAENSKRLETKDNGTADNESRTENRQLIQHETNDVFEIEPDSEDQVAGLLVSTSYWSGALPKPDDFNAYPKEAQSMLLAHLDRRMALQEETVHESFKLDEQSSKRQDMIESESCKQSERGMYLSAALDALLIIGVTVCAVAGQTTVAVILAGFGAITIIPSILKKIDLKRNSSN